MSPEPFALLIPQGIAVPYALSTAINWYRAISGGASTPEPSVVAVKAPTHGWDAFATRGGKGRAPANSQILVAEMLDTLEAARRRTIAEAGGRLVVIAPDNTGFEPHTWRLRDGGYHLGQRSWCRRYALVPANAPLGTFAHELGHLLYGWPDASRRSRIGRDCLMGAGGHHPPGGHPAPPSAPLRVIAEWERPNQPDRSTTVAELATGVFRTVDRAGRGLLVEGRPLHCLPHHILAFEENMPPQLVARLALSTQDLQRPLLAVLRGAV